MTSGTKPFLEKSKQIISDFLQTAVVIDDEATSEKNPKPQKIDKKPGRGSLKKENVTGLAVKERGNTLNTPDLIKACAEHGIFCSIIKPESSNASQIEKIVAPLVLKADVVIIDWEIHDKTGDTCIEVINYIYNKDQEVSNRLRHVVIYTGENDVNKIIDKVISDIECFKDQKFNGDTISFEGFTLSIICKEGTDLPNKSKFKAISELKLANEVVDIYTRNRSGILSNLAFSSMVSLRENTYKIIEKFSSELDAAFLSHRSLLPNPEDSTEFAGNLISDEIHSVILDELVDNQITEDELRCRIESIANTNKTLKDEEESITIALADKVKIAYSGLESFIKEKEITDSKKFEYENFKKLTNIFLKKDNANLNKLFSNLTVNRTVYTKKTRDLTLGTIVKNQDEKYFLCIIPRCDSARIKTSRNFPLLPLSSQGKITLVYPTNANNYKTSYVDLKPYNCKYVEFLETTANRPISTNAEKEFKFQTSNSGDFTWVAELKNDFAQRVSNLFAAEMSRVGVDSFEWLRRQEK